MSIYTRTGDEGTTTLADGRQVPKDAAAIEAYGALDELSSHLGLLATLVPPAVAAELHEQQRRLFAVSALLAGVDAPSYLPDREEVAALERLIDARSDSRKGFGGFVLPGGCPAAAQAQVCRTICRRAERRLVSAATTAGLAYVNRLSDYLFVLAQWLNREAGVPEIRL